MDLIKTCDKIVRKEYKNRASAQGAQNRFKGPAARKQLGALIDIHYPLHPREGQTVLPLEEKVRTVAEILADWRGVLSDLPKVEKTEEPVEEAAEEAAVAPPSPEFTLNVSVTNGVFEASGSFVNLAAFDSLQETLKKLRPAKEEAKTVPDRVWFPPVARPSGSSSPITPPPPPANPVGAPWPADDVYYRDLDPLPPGYHLIRDLLRRWGVHYTSSDIQSFAMNVARAFAEEFPLEAPYAARQNGQNVYTGHKKTFTRLFAYKLPDHMGVVLVGLKRSLRNGYFKDLWTNIPEELKKDCRLYWFAGIGNVRIKVPKDLRAPEYPLSDLPELFLGFNRPEPKIRKSKK